MDITTARQAGLGSQMAVYQPKLLTSSELYEYGWGTSFHFARWVYAQS